MHKCNVLSPNPSHVPITFADLNTSDGNTTTQKMTRGKEFKPTNIRVFETAGERK